MNNLHDHHSHSMLSVGVEGWQVSGAGNIRVTVGGWLAGSLSVTVVRRV